jgi:hypothetical protein
VLRAVLHIGRAGPIVCVLSNARHPVRNRNENVQELRFHDARATFCTWARRAGKSDSRISERTGQKESGKMIDRYDRGAQTLADLQYEPFPNISRAVPELVEIVDRWPRGWPQRLNGRTSQSLKPPRFPPLLL